jgi:hypothetical protein
MEITETPADAVEDANATVPVPAVNDEPELKRQSPPTANLFPPITSAPVLDTMPLDVALKPMVVSVELVPIWSSATLMSAESDVEVEAGIMAVLVAPGTNPQFQFAAVLKSLVPALANVHIAAEADGALKPKRNAAAQSTAIAYAHTGKRCSKSETRVVDVIKREIGILAQGYPERLSLDIN